MSFESPYPTASPRILVTRRTIGVKRADGLHRPEAGVVVGSLHAGIVDQALVELHHVGVVRRELVRRAVAAQYNISGHRYLGYRNRYRRPVIALGARDGQAPPRSKTHADTWRLTASPTRSSDNG